MGDPCHIPGQPFDKETSLRSDPFPRLASQQYNTIQSCIQSFCSFNDPFCDPGLNAFVHLANPDPSTNRRVNTIVHSKKVSNKIGSCSYGQRFGSANPTILFDVEKSKT